MKMIMTRGGAVSYEQGTPVMILVRTCSTKAWLCEMVRTAPLKAFSDLITPFKVYVWV